MKTLLVNRLSHVLEVVFKEIKLCYYRIDQVTKEEYVRVLLRREYCGNADFFDICVTADSETALIDDVWKECKRRFA